MKELRDTIKQHRGTEDELVGFLASEICKIAPADADAIITELAENLSMRYNLPDETHRMLREEVGRLGGLEEQAGGAAVAVSGPDGAPTELRSAMNGMDKHKNLAGLSDSVMHFGGPHRGVLQRVFGLQVTQNYLAALKYFILDDFARQQTKFNFTTKKAVAGIIDVIDEISQENMTKINELVNYRTDSHKWIRRHDFRLDALEAQTVPEWKIDQKIEEMADGLNIPRLEGQILQQKDVMQDTAGNMHRMERTVVENYNELKEMIISRDLKTTEFLLERISRLERMLYNDVPAGSATGVGGIEGVGGADDAGGTVGGERDGPDAGGRI